MRFRKRNKYNAIKTFCLQGHKHDSRLESGYCNMLHSTKDIILVEQQVKFPMIVEGKLICNHIADFVVTYKDGHKECHECKGFETSIWRLKKKLFDALYQMKYVVVK